MGMSDVTCAVSHLPIQCGDPCRFIFLRGTIWPNESPFGHPRSRWIAASLPVAGTYDGYGRVEKFSEDTITSLQVETLALRARPIGAGERNGFLCAEGYPNTLASLMWACDRGLLRLALPEPVNGKTVTVATAPIFVREDAYRAVVAGNDADPPGIGIVRSRLEKHRHQEPVESLRRIVEFAERGESDNSPGSLALRGQLAEVYAMLGSGLASNGETTPDVLVCGSSLEIDPSPYPSLRRFSDADWRRLSEAVFDLEVFYWTMRTELRRELHPVLYRDQFYFPEQGLDAPRMLARYVERWCLEVEEKSRRDQEEDA